MSHELHDELRVYCPNCDKILDSFDEKCSNCEYTLSGVRLYSTKHFTLLAVLLSGLVPIFLAASNYGKLGRTDTKRRLLFLGFIGYLAVFAILILLPETDNTLSKYIGWIINVPVGYYLRLKQKPLYVAAIRLGAGRESLFKGTAKGLGLAIGALIIPIIAMIAVTEIQIDRGESLMEQEKFEEATVHFEKLYSYNSEDPEIVINLVFCYMVLEEWDKAAGCLDAYIKSNDDEAVAHAYFGYIRYIQGNELEGERHIARAESLSPGICNKLFNPDSIPE